MSRPGNGLTAIAVAIIAIAGSIAATRAGVDEHPAGAEGSAVSGTWLCPHGGGRGWSATIAIANPGTEPVQARLTSVGADRAATPITVTVPPGHEVLQTVPAGSRESSTYVETFGGWAAAGWMLRATQTATGLGAEPCTAEGGPTWFVTGQSTERGESSFLVIMNPYGSRATLDVTLFSPNRPPLRSDHFTNIVLPPLRSISLPLNALEGEAAVGAEVDAKIGRVATAALGVTASGGVRSVLAVPAPADSWFLPAGGGAEQTSLSIFAPGEDPVVFDATLLSGEAERPAGDLNAQEQDPASARLYPVLTSGPSSVGVSTSQRGSDRGGRQHGGAWQATTRPRSGWRPPPPPGWSRRPWAVGVPSPGSSSPTPETMTSAWCSDC